MGYTARLDTLQALALLRKLPFLDGWSAKRRANAKFYDKALAGIPGLTTPFVDANNESIFNQYTIRTQRRDALQAFLKGKGIGSAIYYPLPLHLQPCFAHLGYKKGSMPESEKAAAEVLSLPIFPELAQAQLDEVATAVREFHQA